MADANTPKHQDTLLSRINAAIKDEGLDYKPLTEERVIGWCIQVVTQRINQKEMGKKNRALAKKAFALLEAKGIKIS